MTPVNTPPGWDRANQAARLIEAARLRKTPKLSIAKAAAAAGMSGPWWTVNVRGVETRRGRDAHVVPPDDTLMRMAHAVGVEQAVAESLGRPDLLAPEPGEVHVGDVGGQVVITWDKGKRMLVYPREDRQVPDQAEAARLIADIDVQVDRS